MKSDRRACWFLPVSEVSATKKISGIRVHRSFRARSEAGEPVVVSRTVQVRGCGSWARGGGCRVFEGVVGERMTRDGFDD